MLDSQLKGGDDDEKKIPFSNRHTDFALVVASSLESDVVVCKTKMCIFDESKCSWNMNGTDNELLSLVRGFLHDEFRSKYLIMEEDTVPRWKAVGTAPGVLKAHPNIVNVKAEVKSMLCGKAPDATDVRLMLPFRNGMIYDFEKAGAVKVHRGTAPIRIVPHDYASWQIDGDIQREFCRRQRHDRVGEARRRRLAPRAAHRRCPEGPGPPQGQPGARHLLRRRSAEDP
jgi:hypothetical protein